MIIRATFPNPHMCLCVCVYVNVCIRCWVRCVYIVCALCVRCVYVVCTLLCTHVYAYVFVYVRVLLCATNSTRLMLIAKTPVTCSNAFCFAPSNRSSLAMASQLRMVPKSRGSLELSVEFAPSMCTSCSCLKLQVKNTHIPPMLVGV